MLTFVESGFHTHFYFKFYYYNITKRILQTIVMITLKIVTCVIAKLKQFRPNPKLWLAHKNVKKLKFKKSILQNIEEYFLLSNNYIFT